jgi:hypothetical protein
MQNHTLRPIRSGQRLFWTVIVMACLMHRKKAKNSNFPQKKIAFPFFENL